MPDFPVYHQLLELTQTHVHRVGDAIKPSHPLYIYEYVILKPHPFAKKESYKPMSPMNKEANIIKQTQAHTQNRVVHCD